MRRIYTFLLYLLLPFIVLRLYWKGKRLPAYRMRISERFFVKKKASYPVDIWLHAVSLGEVVAATPLIEALLALKFRILVTTMTPTGSQQVIKRFANDVMHQYLPYDYPWAVRQFFKTIQAKIGIIMETELWPNLIIEAKRAGLPLVLANARISDKAFPSYRRARFFFQPILMKFSTILAQSEQDKARFLTLSPKASVKSFGNMKFDLQLKEMDSSFVHSLKKLWGSKRVVFMAASTHENEEQLILNHLRTLQKQIPDILLLITPRHPERFDTVFALSQSLGFNTQRRSFFQQIDKTCEVLIIDAMGELLNFYQVSDYAFIGGSLVPIGGHNVLEAIALQVPVFCGPYMQNSKEICATLNAANAIQQVDSADALIQAVIKMHHNVGQRQSQIKNATDVFTENRGTVQRYLDEIHTMLSFR